MIERPITFDTEEVTFLIWPFIFSPDFLSLTHKLLERKMRLLMYLRASSSLWVGCERDVCVLGLGRCVRWWKFPHRVLGVQNTSIIPVMVDEPAGRPVVFCHLRRKGKLYTACGYGLIQGRYFRNEAENGLSPFHFLSQFQTQKTNDLPQVSLGLCACCLRVNFPSLRRVRPQGRTFTSVCVCPKLSKRVFILFHLDCAVLRRHWDEL